MRYGFAAWVVAAGLAGGCKTVECGANTIEQDGTCVAQATDSSAECGPGTTFNKESGRCENSLFLDGGGLCGPNTTVVVDDHGVRTCVGTGGGGGDCTQPLPCPSPSGSNVSLCGRIYNLEDSKPLDDGNAADGEPYKAIEIRVYDPIAFVSSQNPTVLVRSKPDSCGRFAVVDAPRPATGFIAIATDDDSGASADDFVLTGIAAPVSGGQALSPLRAWVFKRTTDAAWSQAANLPSGMTFGSMGVYVPIFLSGMTAVSPFPATPTSGVQVAIVDSLSGMRTVHADQDFYFSDSDPLSRKVVAPMQNSTGANGTGLYINQPSLGSFSGIGNAGAGDCWRTDLAAAPKGAAYVQERNPGTQFCP
jgi:hypothetical protein